MLCSAASIAVATAAPAAADYPERPSSMLVMAGAGGGGDYTMRLLARGLEERLGKPFNVINQPQASGFVALSNIAGAKPDGYTLGLISFFSQFRLLGQGDMTTDSFTPIALYNADPAAITVNASSPFKTVNEIVEAIRAGPGKYKIHCSGSCNAAWDIPFVALFMANGIDPKKLNMIPGQGAAAGLLELAAGGVDFVLSSVPEATALRDAGKVRTIAVMGTERLKAFPNIPTVSEQLGKPYDGGTFRGLVGPKNLPPEIVAKIEKAAKEVYESESFKKAMEDRGFGLKWADSKGLAAVMKQHEADSERVMKAVGSAK
jgi:tripartite-type tricarboxylate transporter receptor subunit TctC